MSSLTEASTSNALRPNLDSSLTSRIPMRFALQYSIASHNTGRSSFFFAPEMCSSPDQQDGDDDQLNGRTDGIALLAADFVAGVRGAALRAGEGRCVDLITAGAAGNERHGESS